MGDRGIAQTSIWLRVAGLPPRAAGRIGWERVTTRQLQPCRTLTRTRRDSETTWAARSRCSLRCGSVIVERRDRAPYRTGVLEDIFGDHPGSW